jgi:hypothetical protein
MDSQKLQRVFNYESLICYWMYQHLTGQIPLENLFKLISPITTSQDTINNFEVIRAYNKINKSFLSKLFVFTRGFFVSIRVWLFGIQCKVFQKINENMDFMVIAGIFGTQILLQTGLAMAIHGKFSLLVFLGILFVQVVLTFLSTFVAGLYCLARETSNDW